MISKSDKEKVDLFNYLQENGLLPEELIDKAKEGSYSIKARNKIHTLGCFKIHPQISEDMIYNPKVHCMYYLNDGDKDRIKWTKIAETICSIAEVSLKDLSLDDSSDTVNSIYGILRETSALLEDSTFTFDQIQKILSASFVFPESTEDGLLSFPDSQPAEFD